jgi:hypothetical protein
MEISYLKGFPRRSQHAPRPLRDKMQAPVKTGTCEPLTIEPLSVTLVYRGWCFHRLKTGRREETRSQWLEWSALALVSLAVDDMDSFHQFLQLFIKMKQRSTLARFLLMVCTGDRYFKQIPKHEAYLWQVAIIKKTMDHFIGIFHFFFGKITRLQFRRGIILNRHRNSLRFSPVSVKTGVILSYDKHK